MKIKTRVQFNLVYLLIYNIFISNENRYFWKRMFKYSNDNNGLDLLKNICVQNLLFLKKKTDILICMYYVMYIICHSLYNHKNTFCQAEKLEISNIIVHIFYYSNHMFLVFDEYY